MSTFLVQFGAGNPSTYTGLAPTFIVFTAIGVGNTTPPGITEVPTSTGLYYFNYAPQSAVAFVLDGTATITSNPIRYVSGLLDPTSQVPSGITAIGTILGSLGDSIGTTLTDPGTVVAFLKRIQEDLEGNNVFTKQSGAFELWSRGVTHVLGVTTYPGSSQMLIQKVVSDSGSVITKV